jgi:hypothetical protein
MERNNTDIISLIIYYFTLADTFSIINIGHEERFTTQNFPVIPDYSFLM